MLVELFVDNLGVIESARIPLGPGLVALTGETGAGKTMLVEALDLLAGRKADSSRVRVGAIEAAVEGLFVIDDEEYVLRRVVPADGRSRAYINGELATASMLADLAGSILEINGQHGHQELLTPRSHRDALDRFGEIDIGRLEELRIRVRSVESHMERLAGDERERLREMDLVSFQLNEIDSAALTAGEDERLAVDQDVLAGALDYREAAETTLVLLGDDGGVLDRLASAEVTLGVDGHFAELVARLVGLRSELTDCVADLRGALDMIESDPDRLDAVLQRRSQIADLRRKYGDTEAAVLEFAEERRSRLDELRSHERNLAELQQELGSLRNELAAVAVTVGEARRAAAAELGPRIEEQLGNLALPSSRLCVSVEDTDSLPGAGEHVEFLISTNPGVEPGPLHKVASGGELSRVMLALRLVLTESPPTMVFDEVDAGIGGHAATEVGRALAELAVDQQVLVVTHLPQVAAFADVQIRIEKSAGGGVVRTTAVPLTHEERVVELSRMLSGSPGSRSARDHAEELLADADRRRERLG